MKTLHQSPRDPEFVQNPYALYRRVLADDPVRYWEDYGMAAVFDAPTVAALLRDRRLGRAAPPGTRDPAPAHLSDFDAVERTSMLDLEPPAHTRLRGLVLRAFTSRRIKALAPDIRAISTALIDAMPTGAIDLIPAYCAPLPVRIIARLLGVPETMTPDLLRWSNAMVAMYQARRSRQVEDAANNAAADFTAFLTEYIQQRRSDPRDDLISHLIAAEEDGQHLSTSEMVGTCILLLNAGHEATVHTLGNGVKALLQTPDLRGALAPEQLPATVEEILRFDPPLHMFTRFAYDSIDLGGHRLEKGDQVALMLGAAGHDPALFPEPERFDPFRAARAHAAFGGGLHFCVGAPLARLELQIGLSTLFARLPHLRLARPPVYADSYHFHGLTDLLVTR